jgi:starch synthase
MAVAKSLSVVMFAAEAAPYAKVGGLGDVVGALPKALGKLGAKVTVVIPAYGNIQPAKSAAGAHDEVTRLEIPMTSSIEPAEVFHVRMETSGTDVHLIGSERYFGRQGIYDDPVTKEGYPDNMERFVFFMKAGLKLLPNLGSSPDIIHCHDFHTALIPALIKIKHRNDPFFANTGTLFTIHNLAYQGVYPIESLDYAGIDRRLFYPMSPLEYWGRVNFMKAGIEFADKINTVSHTYSVEIRISPERGLGLEGVLQNRKEDVSGIVNGMDYDEWNPETDPFIPAHFSLHDLSGKAECKKHLLRLFGLVGTHNHVPLIGIVSRLADQKGADLLLEAMDEIMALNLHMVILGAGQPKYHEMLRQIASRFPSKIGVRLSFDNELAHRIQAGCDMFLMPSKFEPCGLSQLYSLRYGTIPIVRRTGGLADTVVPFDHGKGTGFSFLGYSAPEMLAAIKQALEVFAKPGCWRPLVMRAMSQDWSWDRSARQYLQLYQRIYSDKHSEGSGIE